jgi:hypothetical protein
MSPGRVNVTVTLDGSTIQRTQNTLQFDFIADASVSRISPVRGDIIGGYPVFVIGNNYVNSSSIACKFGSMNSRGIYVTRNTVVCLAPSTIGKPLVLAVPVAVEVTNNGYDFSASGIMFSYNKETCDAGGYCADMVPQSSPNGTFSPPNSRNFTLCNPGKKIRNTSVGLQFYVSQIM